MNEHWSSRAVFILATAGAAIGLGNIWKFPYMVGIYGGSAFLFLYIICVLIIGIPLMMAEMLIGRHCQHNPVSGLALICQQFRSRVPWQLVGYWGMAGLVIVLSFYSVLSGWAIAYFIRGVSGAFNALTPLQVQGVLNDFLASPFTMLYYHTFFMLLTFIVVVKGVQAGLEQATRYLMPLLFGILFVLVCYSLWIGDGKQALHFLFSFNKQAITTSVVISAMGHAFFTLALGAGAILTYGAYAPEGTKLPGAVITIAILDTLVAVLSGLAIFPIVFKYHMAPTQGPTLLFTSLPTAFATMPGGPLIAGLFFLFLTIAAWTSSINIAETPVAILMERLGWRRKSACIVIGLLAWLLGIGSILSFNVFAHATLNGMTFFEWMTWLPDKILLPIGGLAFAIISGFVMDRETVQNTLPIDSPFWFELWYMLVRYIAPLAIIIIMLAPLVSIL